MNSIIEGLAEKFIVFTRTGNRDFDSKTPMFVGLDDIIAFYRLSMVVLMSSAL